MRIKATIRSNANTRMRRKKKRVYRKTTSEENGMGWKDKIPRNATVRNNLGDKVQSRARSDDKRTGSGLQELLDKVVRPRDTK